MNILRQFNKQKINIKLFCSINNTNINKEILNIHKNIENYNIKNEFIHNELSKISTNILDQQCKINELKNSIEFIEKFAIIFPLSITIGYMSSKIVIFLGNFF